MSDFNLLPCPFCGFKDVLSVSEVPGSRQDKVIYDKIGRRRNHVNISHRVECGYCGATGGSSYESSEATALTAAMVHASEEGAALLWNSREPLNTNALKLVNKLIVDAYSNLDTKS